MGGPLRALTMPLEGVSGILCLYWLSLRDPDSEEVPSALTLPLGGFRHSVFVLVKFDDRDKKSVHSNFKTKTKAFLKPPPCLKRGSRDELLGDGNLLKQYVGTCELNKCIKRPQQTKKKTKTNKKQKKQKTKNKLNTHPASKEEVETNYL